LLFAIKYASYGICFLILAFEICTDVDLGQDSDRDQLYASQQENKTQDENRFAPDIMSKDLENQQIQINKNTQAKRNEAHRSKQVHGFLNILPEKHHRYQIGHDPESSAQSIFRGSESPGVVLHVNLCDFCAGHSSKHRNKS